MGKSLFGGQPIKCCMASHLYKHILGWPVIINDLKEIDGEFYDHLQGLKGVSTDADTSHLDFTVTEEISGERRIVELVPGRSSIGVTEGNQPEYFEACLKCRLLGQYEAQLSQLLLGFFDVIPQPLVTVFDF